MPSPPGWRPLGLQRRPRDLATQQAAASVGQQLLAERYAGSFARHRLTVGQILLTSDDVVRRAHYRNAQRTFGKLLSFGVVPVVNENDTVATAEIRFGDNDRLAALVAHLVGAGALILLSDVDALYTGDPRLATSVAGPRGAGRRRAGRDRHRRPGQRCRHRRDGIQAHLGADRDRCRHSGAARLGGRCRCGAAGLAGPVTNRRADGRHRLRAGHPADQCPVVLAAARRDRSGSISLDHGAVAAVVNRRKSLLPAGITAFYGDFESGDVVDLLAPDGEIVARGFVGHDAAEMPGIIGRTLSELPAELRHPVVHADDLIAVPSTTVAAQRDTSVRRADRRTKEPRHVRDRSAVIGNPVAVRRIQVPAVRRRGSSATGATRERGARIRRPGRRPPPRNWRLLTRAVKDRALLAMADALLDRRDGDPGRERARRAGRDRCRHRRLAGGPAAARTLLGSTGWPPGCASWPGCPTRSARWCAVRCCPTVCT